MKKQTSKIVDIKLPAKQAFSIPTDIDFVKLNCLMCINGRRGSGKTLALCNFLRVCREKNYFDKIYCVTPSYNSNRELLDIAMIEEEDVFEPSVDVLQDIIQLCELEKKEYEQFLIAKARYKKFKRDMRTHRQILDEDLLEYEMLGLFEMEGPPKWKYPKEQMPRCAIMLDDCLNTPIMACRSAGLTNLAIRHRHVLDGNGISLFMLVQSYCAHGGVPRVIRENCTHLLLFKINDEKQIEKIKQECDLPITDDEFQSLLTECHNEDHQFLMIDFAPKCPAKMFRKGWNEYLIPNSLASKCKCVERKNVNS